MKALEYYLSLPWTVDRSLEDGLVTLRVRELPGFAVAAATDEELQREFWIGLECFIESYLQEGEEPPVPEKIKIRRGKTEKTETNPTQHLAVEDDSIRLKESVASSEPWERVDEIVDPWSVPA